MPKQVPEKSKGIPIQKLLDECQVAVCSKNTPASGEAFLTISKTYIHIIDEFRRRIGSNPLCVDGSQAIALKEDISRVAENNDFMDELNQAIARWVLLARQECRNCLTKKCANRDPEFQLEEEKKTRLVLA